MCEMYTNTNLCNTCSYTKNDLCLCCSNHYPSHGNQFLQHMMHNNKTDKQAHHQYHMSTRPSAPHNAQAHQHMHINPKLQNAHMSMKASGPRNAHANQHIHMHPSVQNAPKVIHNPNKHTQVDTAKTPPTLIHPIAKTPPTLIRPEKEINNLHENTNSKINENGDSRSNHQKMCARLAFVCGICATVIVCLEKYRKYFVYYAELCHYYLNFGKVCLFPIMNCVGVHESDSDREAENIKPIKTWENRKDMDVSASAYMMVPPQLEMHFFGN